MSPFFDPKIGEGQKIKHKKKGLRRKINGFLVQMRLETKQNEKTSTPLPQISGVMVSHHDMVSPGADSPPATPRFHSILEIFYSILASSVSKFPFHLLFHFIPCAGSHATASLMTSYIKASIQIHLSQTKTQHQTQSLIRQSRLPSQNCPVGGAVTRLSLEREVNSRTCKIGLSVANDSPPLQRFFGAALLGRRPNEAEIGPANGFSSKCFRKFGF